MRRLLNLSLGASALWMLLASFTGWLHLLPSRWLLGAAGLLDLHGVSAGLKLAVALSFNFWLPAGFVLVLVSFFGGQARAQSAQTSPGAALLTIAWLGTLLLMPLSGIMGWLALVLGFGLAPLFWLLFALGLAGVALEGRALWIQPASEENVAWWPSLLVATAPPVFAVIALLLTSGSQVASALQQRDTFRQACSSAGVEYLAEPARMPTSVAYEHTGERHWYFPVYGRIEVDGQRVTGYGMSSRVKPSDERPNYEWAFREGRSKPDDPSSPLVRWTGSERTGVPIDALTADLLIKTDSMFLTREGKVPGLTQVTVSLSDRQTGTLYARMKYIVDKENKRACGANAGDIISASAFVYDALQHFSKRVPSR